MRTVAVAAVALAAGVVGVPSAVPDVRAEFPRRGFDSRPQWSPDGREIAFTRETGTGSYLVAAAVDGSGERLLASAPPASTFLLSPDWRWIAWDVRNFELWIMRSDGSDRRLVLKSGYWILPEWTTRNRLVFSNGRGGAFPYSVLEADADAVRDVPGLPSTAGEDRYLVFRYAGATADLLMTDAAGRILHVVAHDIGLASDLPRRARWSPDGMRVAFSMELKEKVVFGVAPATGARLRVLATGAKRAHVFGWNWGPDSSSLIYSIFTFGEGTPDGIYRLAVEAGTIERLHPKGGQPVWSPDGRNLAFMFGRECELPGVFLLDLRSRRVRRLTNDCRILGTPAADTLVGTDGRDFIFGFAGDDRLQADVSFLVYARNELHGGPGDDELFGGTGIDALFGGAGDDLLAGGHGADRILAGAGNDRVEAGRGADVLFMRDGMKDVVFCGENGTTYPYRDTVFADAVDWVSRDCEVVARA